LTGRGSHSAAPKPAGPGWLFWPFLLLVLSAPALLGANRPVAWSALALGMGVLLLAWAAASGGAGAAPVPLRRLAPAALPLLLAAGWAALQTVPVPPVLRDSLWTEAAAALGQPLSARISLAPEEAGTGIMRLITYGAVLLLGTQFGHSARRESAILWAVALAGGAYALYGLVVWADGNRTILWMAKWAYAESLTSTFVSRNSYATFAGVGLCATLALLARAVTKRTGASANAAAVLLSLALLITAALLLTGSRGGTGSAFLAAVAMAILGLCGAEALRPRLAFGGSALALLAASTAVLGSGVIERLAPEATQEWGGRSGIWAGAAAAALDRPLGGGLGAFADFFPAYRDLALGLEFGSIDKAHNLYLELSAELGLPVAAALVAGVGWLALRVTRASLSASPGAALAAAGASVLVAVHSLLDFSLQIPGVTASFMLLLGAGLGQVERRQASAVSGPRRESAHRDPAGLGESLQPIAGAADR
jgi:O-antigen ligase